MMDRFLRIEMTVFGDSILSSVIEREKRDEKMTDLERFLPRWNSLNEM